MRYEEQVITKQMPHMKSRTPKEELEQRNRLRMVNRKHTGQFSPFLFARNLTFNSDAALNYKYSQPSL